MSNKSTKSFDISYCQNLCGECEKERQSKQSEARKNMESVQDCENYQKKTAETTRKTKQTIVNCDGKHGMDYGC